MSDEATATKKWWQSETIRGAALAMFASLCTAAVSLWPSIVTQADATSLSTNLVTLITSGVAIYGTAKAIRGRIKAKAAVTK